MNLDYNIPEGWAFPRFEELTLPCKGAIKIGPFGSALKKHEFSLDGIRVLGIDHVKPEGLIWQFPKYIPESKYSELTQYTVEDNDILVTNMGTVGKACIVPVGFPKAIISSHLIKASLDQNRCYPEYIAKTLNHCPIVVAQIKAKCHGAIMAGFNSSLLKSIQIPLPPLPEQKRIAAILDKADSIKRKRQEAVRLTEELLRSVFLDMFGDPVTNPKGWEVKPLGQLIAEKDKINYGVVQPGDDFQGGVPVVRVGDFNNGSIDKSNLKTIDPAIASKHKKSRLIGDEVLIACVGSIGAIALADESLAGFNIVRAVARVRPSKKLLKEYLASYLLTPFPQSHFTKETRTVSQPTLNINLIENTPVILPPIDLQRDFVETFYKIQGIIGQLAESCEGSEQLFNSLLQRAFTGEM
jgi:type I restriction enzyme S subunit